MRTLVVTLTRIPGIVSGSSRSSSISSSLSAFVAAARGLLRAGYSSSGSDSSNYSSMHADFWLHCFARRRIQGIGWTEGLRRIPSTMVRAPRGYGGGARQSGEKEDVQTCVL